jgi:hypothetical protein
MPLQNRVTPDGKIVETPARGTTYGNRGGCFHRDDGSLKRRHWANRQWICCVLQFKDRRRVLRQPGKFTELFFLDEATAFAAGHRPCFECRRADAEAYRGFWANAHGIDEVPSAPQMDVMLHDQRLNARGEQRVFKPHAEDIVAGVMVRWDDSIWLVQNGHLRRWSLFGYSKPIAMPAYQEFQMLTPPATVATLRAGFRPQLHPTAADEG